MAAQTSQKLAGVISCHSWSPDGSQLALCPNSSEVHLYRAYSDKPWALENVLQQHDRLVSGVDWCPHSNRIVTCSHDLNAYVWTCRADQQWKPDMVSFLLTDRAFQKLAEEAITEPISLTSK